MRGLLLLAMALGCAAPRGAQVARARYEADLAPRLVPLLSEVLRFRTVKGDAEGHAAQKAWLLRAAAGLGLVGRDAGLVTEIELPGPPGAPVLGLLVHGDVQPVEPEGWTFPPFSGRVHAGHVWGRGAADDKGPLVQALLAMRAVSGLSRTHTIRLLVGSDEESDNEDIKTYLKAHAPPDYSLVLDSDFPVTVGEKAWDGFAVAARPAPDRKPHESWEVESMDAGLSPSIVPDRAALVLRWRSGEPRWGPLRDRLSKRALPEGTSLSMDERGASLALLVRGKAAHGGVNLEGGRNALVALARLVEGELGQGGAGDLFAFARLAGADRHGQALRLQPPDPLWGGFTVNVATLKPSPLPPAHASGPSTAKPAPAGGGFRLYVNLRRPPPMSARQMSAHMESVLAEFNARTGAKLVRDGGYMEDEPFVVDPRGKLVRRLLAAFERGTGRAQDPVTSGGGTYAKRLPNAVAFGMWFRGAPYPGHDVDEKIPIADLHAGMHVLIEALADLATGPRIDGPLAP